MSEYPSKKLSELRNEHEAYSEKLDRAIDAGRKKEASRIRKIMHKIEGEIKKAEQV